MTKKLEGSVRSARRRRRGALRPALTGLTVFSLTCLVLGSAVYAAAVPGLVMSSNTIAAAVQAPSDPAVGSQRMMASILGELIGSGQSNGEGFETSEDAAEGASGSAGSSSVGGFSSLGSFVSGSLQGFAGLSSDNENDRSDDSAGANDDANKGDSAQGEASDSNQNQDSNPKPENPDDDTASDPEPEPEPTPEPAPTPEPDGPTPEEEAEYHEYLVGYANGLNGYVERIAASRAYFEGGWGAPILHLPPDQIDSMYSQSQILCDDVTGAWGTLRNGMAYKDDSQWQPAATDLIYMHMLLLRYSEGLEAAWRLAYTSSTQNDLGAYWPQVVGIIEEAQPYLDEYNAMANAGVAL